MKFPYPLPVKLFHSVVDQPFLFDMRRKVFPTELWTRLVLRLFGHGFLISVKDKTNKVDKIKEKTCIYAIINRGMDPTRYSLQNLSPLKTGLTYRLA